MNHCKDCRHWERPAHFEDLGVCRAHPARGKMAIDVLTVYCSEPGDATMRTAATFGCTEFEAK